MFFIQINQSNAHHGQIFPLSILKAITTGFICSENDVFSRMIDLSASSDDNFTITNLIGSGYPSTILVYGLGYNA